MSIVSNMSPSQKGWFEDRKNRISEKIAKALDCRGYNYSFLDSIKPYHAPFINRYWRDSQGNTLTHYAARLGFKNRIRQMVDLGCPLLLPNNGESESKKRKRAGEIPYEIFMHNKPKTASFLDIKAEGDVKKFIDSLREARLSKIYPRDGTSNYPRLASDMYGDGKRVHPGVFYISDLEVCYRSKKHNICTIPDQSDVLSTELIARMEEKINSKNFVVANIGFVVSTASHKVANHKLTFVTLPITHAEYLIYAEHDSEIPIHSEEQVYHFLSQPSVLKEIVLRLKKQSGIDEGYKIYAVILDMHSTRRMCEWCESETYKLQAGNKYDFLSLLENVLRTHNYILPRLKKIAPDLLSPQRFQLNCVTRISASLDWETASNEPPVDLFAKGAYYPRFSNEQFTNRNIKQFYNSVILHREIPSLQTFVLKKKQCSSAVLPQQTLFINTHPDRTLRLERRSITS